MKFLQKSFILVFFIAIPFLNYAQREGISWKDLYKKVGDVLNLVDEKGLEVVRMEFDLILKDHPKPTYRVLYPDYEYTVVVLGDYRVEEMDVNAYENTGENWKFVTSANNRGAASGKTSSSSSSGGGKEKGFVMFTIKPEKRVEYRVDVKGTKYLDKWSGGHYAIIFIHK